MKILKNISFVLVWTTVSHPLVAQTVPMAMTYQGRLTDASNIPIADGTGTEIEVRLWNAATGGTLLWGARHAGVPIRSGAFNLILGSGGTPITGASTTDLKQAFNTTPVYFGITMIKGPDGKAIASPSEILPRQQVFSSPFSFRASSAISVETDGVLSTSIKDGEVKAQDLAANAITTPAILNGVVTAEKLAPGAAQANLSPASIAPEQIAADYAVFRDEKPGNTGGGGTSTGWNIRTLNAGTIASPPGGSKISRTGDTITLQNGTYLIEASGPMYAMGNSQLVLRDVTENPTPPVIALRGTSDYTTQSATTSSTIQDYLTVVGGPRKYELWQYFSSPNATSYRMGFPLNPNNISNAPDTNVYTRIHIQRMK